MSSASPHKRGRTLRPAEPAHSITMDEDDNSSVWLNKLLERSTRTQALRKVQPHMPRRHHEVGGQFQRKRLRASRPPPQVQHSPIGSFPLSPASALSSSYRTTIQKKSSYGSSNKRTSTNRGGRRGRGGRDHRGGQNHRGEKQSGNIRTHPLQQASDELKKHPRSPKKLGSKSKRYGL